MLRRVLRRATRYYGQQILGAKPGFFATLVPVVVETFGNTYPERIKSQDRILEIIQEEEQRAFSIMLERDIKFFTELEEELKKDNNSRYPAAVSYFLAAWIERPPHPKPMSSSVCPGCT